MICVKSFDQVNLFRQIIGIRYSANDYFEVFILSKENISVLLIFLSNFTVFHKLQFILKSKVNYSQIWIVLDFNLLFDAAASTQSSKLKEYPIKRYQMVSKLMMLTFRNRTLKD